MNLRKIYGQLAENYWFFPGLMTLAGVFGGLLAASLDRWFEVNQLLALLGLDRVSAEGARSLLSTAAASMIGVAGVTFSITIAAIATVTTQFGSRVFANFMEDRGSQLTLGIFLGTFAYCMVVLGWVRSPTESHGGFVPQIALAGGMLLVLLSVGGLIYFIHHTTDMLRIQTQIDAVGRQMRRAINERFESGGDASETGAPEPEWDRHDEIVSTQAGYVRRIDHAELVSIARDNDCALRVLVSPGDFVMTGQAILRHNGTQDDLEAARGAFRLGASRSAAQDITYYLDQLVEIAVRALSPGINDPFTAGNAVDWLSEGFAALSGRQLPGAVVSDDAGSPRVFRNALDFEAVVDGTLSQLMPYFAGDRNATLQLMDALVCCYRACNQRHRRAVFAEQATRLREMAADKLDPQTLAVLDRRIDSLDRREAEEEDDDDTPRAG
ncbi:MAG: DUF2254 domain-containing protein [Xanthomonadales bacterium]|nr:DUF2254 domain-containing protein [Xanthomonadales bacterium]